MEAPALSIAGRVTTISATLFISIVPAATRYSSDCAPYTITLPVDRLSLLLEPLADGHALQMLLKFLKLRPKLIHAEHR